MQRQAWLTAAVVALIVGAGVSLTRVFTTDAWRAEALGAMVIALVLAAAVHRIGLGLGVSIPVSLVGLFVFTYVVHLPSGPLFPGWEQLSELGSILRDGIVQLREQPAPTAPLDGLRLVVTTGVWLVTFVVHELLVRLRRPIAALIPAAVLWIVPLSVPLPPGRTWPQALPFLAAVMLVLLLEAEGDRTGWTREDDDVNVSSTGLALGASALMVAAILPGILPGYQSQPWVDLGPTDDPRGYQPIVDIGDRLKLPDERDVLEVDASRPVYLRLAALDTFDGTTWRLGPAGVASYRPDTTQLFRTEGVLPFEAPIDVGTRTAVDVTVLDLENIYVPVPYQLERINGPKGMFYSLAGGFVATGDLEDNEISGELRVGVRPGFEYSLQAVIPSPSYLDLTALGDQTLPPEDPRVQLPGPYGELADLARTIYDDAGATTTIDRVLAVQDYFIGDESSFTYSTDVPSLRGDLALQRFVFDTNEGYCEYFATAMAVMLRATGIPARVAVGFLPGTPLRVPDEVASEQDAAGAAPDDMTTYRVSTTDAHAWVEVLFDGYGWVRMDPTPRSDGATIVPTVDDLDPLLTERALRDQTPIEQPSEGDGPAPNPTVTDDLPPSRDNEPLPPQAGTGSTGLSRELIVVLATLVLAMSAIAAITASRSQRRRRQRRAGAAGAVLAEQRELLHAAATLGVPRQPHETIAEVLLRWAAEGRITVDSALAFTHLARAAAFGGTLPDNAEAESAARAAEILRGLRASVTRSARVLAPVRLPLDSASAVATGLARSARDLVSR